MLINVEAGDLELVSIQFIEKIFTTTKSCRTETCKNVTHRAHIHTHTQTSTQTHTHTHTHTQTYICYTHLDKHTYAKYTQVTAATRLQRRSKSLPYLIQEPSSRVLNKKSSRRAARSSLSISLELADSAAFSARLIA